MTKISPDKFLDFITYYRKDNPNHEAAMKAFAAKVDPALMDDSADWVKLFRTAPSQPSASAAPSSAANPGPEIGRAHV